LNEETYFVVLTAASMGDYLKVGFSVLKVLIVDDEILIRVGVKSCLDWEKYGFEVVGLAENGVKALNLVEKLAPDIVLTDIKMPNMDGLKLIEVLRKDYPQIKVIVLSCYNEMEYVKRAMKLGAEDYLLKLSVQPETLLEIMNRVKAAIEEEREEELKTRQAENTIRISKQILKDNVYKKFLKGALSTEDYLLALAELDLKLVLDHYWVVCCRINDGLSERSFTEQPLRDYSFRNIVLEMLADFGQCDLAEVEGGLFVLVIANNPGLNVMEVCQNLSSAVTKYLNAVVSFGVSQGATGAGKLKEQYRQARTALNHMFYDGRGSIRQFNEKLSFSGEPVLIGTDIENLLISAVESLDRDQAWSHLEGLFTEFANQKKYAPEAVKYAIIEVIYKFNSLSKKYDLHGRFFNADVKDDLSAILRTETLQDLKAWLKKYIHNLVDALSDFKLERERPEIAKIKSYIHQNIEKNITLEDAAEICNLSKAYFSTLFKKEVGESFTDYTNRLKMEKARELICNYGLRCYEAAEKVGIFDQSYFSKLFKKYIGEKPSTIKG